MTHIVQKTHALRKAIKFKPTTGLYGVGCWDTFTEAVLQILLIFAYLDIGLISVTFPIHAICMSYLSQEKTQLEKDRRRKAEALKTQIARLTEELKGEQKDSTRFKQIRGQIKNYEAEVRDLESKLKSLSAKGAVRDPILLLLGGLLAAAIGVAFYYCGQTLAAIALAALSLASSVYSLSLLYRAVSTVESAALRRLRIAEFEVKFKSGGNTEKIKLGTDAELDIGVIAEDEAIEKATVSLLFSPDVKIKDVIGGNGEKARIVQQPDWYAYPNYNAVSWDDDLNLTMYKGVIVVVSAEKTGKIEIPVRITARAIYEFWTKLFLEVSEK